jgi:hypothetical protein
LSLALKSRKKLVTKINGATIITSQANSPQKAVILYAKAAGTNKNG